MIIEIAAKSDELFNLKSQCRQLYLPLGIFFSKRKQLTKYSNFPTWKLVFIQWYQEKEERYMHIQLFMFLILVGWLIGWLVDFYGLSAVVGYSMPNLVYTYILNS